MYASLGVSQTGPSCSDVLTYYNENTARYVAVAMVTAGYFPEEILNEVRAAFTHVAKANALDPADPECFEENRNALRHLKRVCLDCLKVSILFDAERVDTDLDHLTGHTRLPQAVYREAEELKKERMRILGHEASHPTNGTIGELFGLFEKYDEFSSRLRKEYGGYYGEAIEKKARRQQRNYMIGGAIVGMIFGIFGSLVANFIYDCIKGGGYESCLPSFMKTHDRATAGGAAGDGTNHPASAPAEPSR
jgi:hypothetical protein